MIKYLIAFIVVYALIAITPKFLIALALTIGLKTYI